MAAPRFSEMWHSNTTMAEHQELTSDENQDRALLDCRAKVQLNTYHKSRNVVIPTILADAKKLVLSSR